jgi:putative acyl-CoA dehydrogenase
MGLDVLRAAGRNPDAIEAVRGELAAAKGMDRRFDRARAALDEAFTGAAAQERSARRFVERLVLALQAALLLRHGDPGIADAFCASRLDGDWGHAFGTLPDGIDTGALARRSAPLGGGA